MKPKINQLINKSVVRLKRGSPTVLTCLGVAGVVATTVSAVMATPKAIEKIRKDSLINHDGDPCGYSKTEAIRSAWVYYIPSTVIGVSTITCIVGANVLNRHQQASLSSAYALINKSYKQYAEQAVDAAAKAASSASQASGYASTANSRANAAASSASGAANSASAASTSAANAKSYADSAASSKNASASSASNASASATNAKKSETAAASSASLAQAAYEEILRADVGKFGSQLANEHSVLQPIYDSSGQNICDSSGREIQGRIIFADESEVVSLRQQVSHLDTFIRSVISRLGYVTDHALLDSDYKGL